MIRRPPRSTLFPTRRSSDLHWSTGENRHFHAGFRLRQLPRRRSTTVRVISRRQLGAIGEDAAVRVLRRAIERLSLSARANDRALRLARAIADLDGSAAITATQLAEAVQYRAFDRPLRLLG